MSARFIVGDVFDGLATLADGSVDLVVTSPPFLALRSYLPADHPDKHKEIGSEPTPAAFLDVMLAVTAELRRVLAPHGSICIELGDTYSGAGGYGSPDSPNPAYGNGERFGERWEGRTAKRFKRKDDGWPERKSLALIPELYRIALAYGINPLTGASPAGRWRVRNNVTWCRPNPPVGALGDKWRPATSDVVIACTSDKRYWDDIATRRPHVIDPAERPGANGRSPKRMDANGDSGSWQTKGHTAGAPLLDYWEIPPGGYSGSHYAVFPAALVEPLVKAMAPPKVCRTCGEPSRRIVGNAAPTGGKYTETTKGNGARVPGTGDRGGSSFPLAEAITLDWSDCGCSNGHCSSEYACDEHWRPALVLDCFAGSGTTLAVATGHGHDAVGIDLDARNYALALDRVGPMLLGEAELVGGVR